MHKTLAVAAALAGSALAVTAPSAAPPAGFVTTYSSAFQITAVKAAGFPAPASSGNSKRNIEKRAACPTSTGSLVITLKDGVLTDQNGRVADVVANYQFQFDPAPGQAGYIYNGGFSVGSNSSLALGDSAIFYECKSGSFYNLYTQSVAPYCIPINIDIIPCGSGSSTGAVSQQPDGQPTVTSAISQVTDGQPQATSAISEISDGQPQATSAISEISDGQPQAQSATVVMISQISDGQPQVPTGLISQIGDGQPQAPTSIVMPGTPISQISDGQPQVPTGTGTPISQIGDGQPQVPTGSNSTATPSVITVSGGNALVGTSFVAIIGAFVAALL